MRVSRSRAVRAPVEDVWRVAADPWHLPRWWPRTERVEAVSERGWTSVLVTDRGRPVRADYRVDASEPPRRRAWSQEVAGTPFERLLSSVCWELTLEPEPGGGTRVGLELRQGLRGWARFGGFLVRRAGARQLDAALSGLAEAVEA